MNNIKESIRQVNRSSNQDEFDDQLSLGGRVIFLGGIVVLCSGWMWLIFWSLSGG